MAPTEGYDEQEEEENDFVRFGMKSIDRIISAIDSTFILPVINGVIEKMLIHENW